MRTVFKYLKPYKMRMLLGFTIKVLGTVSELFLPMILTHILDNVIKGKNPYEVIGFGVLMMLCAASACILNIIANRMAGKVSSEFAHDMRRDLFEKTLYLSARATDKITVPSLESRITTDTYNVHNFVGMMQRMGVRAPILLIGGMTITLIMDAYLALVMLAILPFIFCTVFFISKCGVPLYTRVQGSVDGMIRVVREDAQGVRVIKALSKGEYENRRYDAVNKRLSRDERTAGTVMGIVNPLMTLFMNLGIAAVVAMSAYRATESGGSTATVIAFIQYFTLISMAMLVLSRIFVMYTKCAASAKRIDEVINYPDEYKLAEKGEICNTGAHVSFENVSFSYLGRKNTLENITVSVGHGESLGIIGSTGSGKSTLVKLLLRFYEADEGRILIDGADIMSLEREALTAKLGVVMQNDFLIADTVLENIRFGRDISDDKIKRAAKIAQAHDFITALEGGYGYTLSAKGTNLSGGQRQRLLIARAVAANPEILILDDSSSALDYKTDAALRKALSESLEGTTVITVAQRVSSVKGCEVILVLDEGKIIGKGTHEQLLEECPEYREIADSQMGGAFLE